MFPWADRPSPLLCVLPVPIPSIRRTGRWFRVPRLRCGSVVTQLLSPLRA